MKKMSFGKKKRDLRKYLLAASAGLFLVGTVVVAIDAAANGSELAALEKKERELAQENRDLSDQINEASSLSGAQEKALELNFAKPEKIVYIGAEEPIAKAP